MQKMYFDNSATLYSKPECVYNAVMDYISMRILSTWDYKPGSISLKKGLYWVHDNE